MLRFWETKRLPKIGGKSNPRFASFPQPYASKVLEVQPSNLIAYWRLNETLGTVSSNDKGDSSFNGTYSRDVSLMGVQGGIGDGITCPVFSPASDRISIGTASLGSAFSGQEFTISIWAKVASSGIWTDGVRRECLRIFDNAFDDYIWLSKDSTNNQWWIRYSAAGTIKDIRPASGGVLDWVHLAVTVSKVADAVKFFVNGSQAGATKTGLGTFLASVDFGYIGSADSLQNNAWDGQIGHLAIFDAPLTPAQIANLATV